jgi:hypothetical protein
MSSAQSSHGRPRRAAPMPGGRRRPSGRPRRWGRLLVTGLSVVLVAALVPRVLADSSDGTASFESTAELAPTDAAADTDGGGEVAEASVPGAGEGGPEPDAQLAAEHEPEPPQDVDAGRDDTGAGDRFAAAQDQLGDLAGCGAGSCSEGPADPGRLIGTVIRGGTGSPGGDQPHEPQAPREFPRDDRYETDPWNPDAPLAEKLEWIEEIFQTAMSTQNADDFKDVLGRIEGVMPELSEPSDRDQMEKLRTQALEQLRAQGTLDPPGVETGEQRFSGVQAAPATGEHPPAGVQPAAGPGTDLGGQQPGVGAPPSRVIDPPAGPAPYTTEAPVTGLPPMEKLGWPALLGGGALVLFFLSRFPHLGHVLRQGMPTLFPTSTPGAT